MSGWTIEKRVGEHDYVLRHESLPLVFVRPLTSLGQSLDAAGPFAVLLVAKLHQLSSGVAQLRARGEQVAEALIKLEAWLRLDTSGTTQLFVGRTGAGNNAGFEVGFARFGVLSMRTSKGSSLIQALLAAAEDMHGAIELDGAEPPADPSEEG